MKKLIVILAVVVSVLLSCTNSVKNGNMQNDSVSQEEVSDLSITTQDSCPDEAEIQQVENNLDAKADTALIEKESVTPICYKLVSISFQDGVKPARMGEIIKEMNNARYYEDKIVWPDSVVPVVFDGNVIRVGRGKEKHEYTYRTEREGISVIVNSAEIIYLNFSFKK